MITHSRAKQILMNIDIKNFTIEDLHFFTTYILQQEKKDELLGLYQEIWKIQHQDELTISAYTYEDLIELISKKEKLEKELGEMK